MMLRDMNQKIARHSLKGRQRSLNSNETELLLFQPFISFELSLSEPAHKPPFAGGAYREGPFSSKDRK